MDKIELLPLRERRYARHRNEHSWSLGVTSHFSGRKKSREEIALLSEALISRHRKTSCILGQWVMAKFSPRVKSFGETV